ncbi:ribonuclease H family protein [Terrilactibacillus laevilacticus]|uniref:Ribonuclease H family protein n=1 Tax=Terrilactibacillus laevilacticus TaxID=1380157 RepID=A0ABW5PNQ5_9BACI|nr:ribonuclease H family protein [Terrilactibacillus laevilacticus]
MNVRIEITYKTRKGTETTFSSAEMRAEKALLIAEDLERTGRAKNLIFIDSNESTWSMKELKKYLQGIQTEPHHVTAYFDGGFDLETKKSGLGCVIYFEQNGKFYRVRKNALVSYLDTNNEAEYAALHLVVKELENLGVHHLPVKFTGDSLVVINQLSGEWPVFEEELNKWADRIDRKLEQLGITPEYELVPRKNNQEADKLASQALREIEITGTIEIDGENKFD